MDNVVMLASRFFFVSVQACCRSTLLWMDGARCVTLRAVSADLADMAD